MNNPFFPPAPIVPMQGFEQAFQQFKSSFQGDPREEINRRLASGEITQGQVNAAFQKARQMGLLR